MCVVAMGLAVFATIWFLRLAGHLWRYEGKYILPTESECYLVHRVEPIDSTPPSL